VRFTIALRSPLAFRAAGVPVVSLQATTEPVVIVFEGREFAWHPPHDYESELTGRIRHGPMLAVLQPTDAEALEVASSAQRFLSAVAYLFDQPVQDVTYGGIGGDDILNPAGARDVHGYGGTFLAEAPSEIEVVDDEDLRVALAYYREGLNAASPFYRCLAYKNVLDAVFDVKHELVSGQVTAEATARDTFIDANAPIYANQLAIPQPPTNWSDYLREDVRNALAHVNRQGRREIDPDDPAERVRLNRDSGVTRRLARDAIAQRWPQGVRTAPAPD
jgi:hypothetical protein